MLFMALRDLPGTFRDLFEASTNRYKALNDCMTLSDLSKSQSVLISSRATSISHKMTL